MFVIYRNNLDDSSMNAKEITKGINTVITLYSKWNMQRLRCQIIEF